MAYLNKQQRREMILHVAKDFALKIGLQAMTVRCIAHAAHISTGQIHHHFESLSHLKAEVFTQLMQELDAYRVSVQVEDWHQKMEIFLRGQSIEYTQSYLKLWSEAESLLGQDAQLEKAYQITMQQWHTTLVNLIDQGIAKKAYSIRPYTQSTDIAWRLMAFVCGFEGLLKLNLTDLNQLTFDHQIHYMIKTELFYF